MLYWTYKSKILQNQIGENNSSRLLKTGWPLLGLPI